MKAAEDDCSAKSKLFNSIIWPLTSNVISIASLSKGVAPHPSLEIKKLNLKTKEGSLRFHITYFLVSLQLNGYLKRHSASFLALCLHHWGKACLVPIPSGFHF